MVFWLGWFLRECKKRSEKYGRRWVGGVFGWFLFPFFFFFFFRAHLTFSLFLFIVFIYFCRSRSYSHSCSFFILFYHLFWIHFSIISIKQIQEKTIFYHLSWKPFHSSILRNMGYMFLCIKHLRRRFMFHRYRRLIIMGHLYNFWTH